MFQIELVEQCKANNRKAQMQLYRQYCEGMFTVALRFVKDPDDAEDVLQESFIKAFQRIDQFKGEVTFGAWLKKIVVNRSIDFLKSNRKRLTPLEEKHMAAIPVDAEDWTVEDEVDIDEIKLAMEQLPDKYGLVLKLYLIEGYDHAEISEILAISETASRTRLLRGKTQLQERLKKQKL
ncbi:MAG: RNA polymerase sigma factor [Bacteroidota bacterium]